MQSAEQTSLTRHQIDRVYSRETLAVRRRRAGHICLVVSKVQVAVAASVPRRLRLCRVIMRATRLIHLRPRSRITCRHDGLQGPTWRCVGEMLDCHTLQPGWLRSIARQLVSFSPTDLLPRVSLFLCSQLYCLGSRAR